MLEEFTERIIEVNRTAKKTKGGNRMAFSALVVVGDKKGRVGLALAKASEVALAIRKAIGKAKKNLMEFPLVGEAKTIPHAVELKKGAVRILLKPAPAGTGVRAGGPLRSPLEVAGVQNIVGKMLGTRNKKGNAYAVIEALGKLKKPEEKLR